MKKTILTRWYLLILISAISFAGCSKEEWDFAEEETEQSTIVEGTILSSSGKPLADVIVNMDYYEGKWLQYSNVRHKAETKTDKSGKYRLHFLVKEDEVETIKDKELGISRSYSLTFDLKNLNPKEYILPDDMMVMISSVNPPIAKLTDELETTIKYSSGPLERSKTYTENLYIPQKRYVQVTLKGFIPQQRGNDYDHFELGVAFPYGGESASNILFPDNKYGFKKVDNLFVLYTHQEQTFEVPFALNENNIITLIRKKGGVYSTEEHKVFITKDSPAHLVYEY